MADWGAGDDAARGRCEELAVVLKARSIDGKKLESNLSVIINGHICAVRLIAAAAFFLDC